jgi:glycosyltransferase involved in cell wall biosynthesis
VQALRHAGASVRVLSLTRGEFWEARLKDVGASVIWVGQEQSRVARLCRIVARLREERPSLVQSMHFFTNLYVVGAARLLRLREVGAIRNDAYCEIGFTGRLGSLSLHAPKLLAANSRAGVDNAMALGVPSHRVRMLPNVVDTDQFRPAVRPRNGKTRLLTIGIRPEKRIDRFLSLMKRLEQRHPQLEAVIIGDGPRRPGYECEAKRLGVSHLVSFTGGRSVTASDYQDADVLVMSSDFEGTPNVILEAMASGVPVVAYRTGGVSEIVQHGQTGYVLDSSDESGMLDAVSALITDADLRAAFGARARTHMEANYATGRLPAILTNFYTEALA